MARIPISRNMFVTVDDADLAALSSARWTALPASSTRENFYAVRSVKAGVKRKTIYMHREIMEAPDGVQVDHVDGNGLNNQRSNLRLCDQRLNNVNRRHYSPVSGFRGVYPTAEGRWTARVYSLGNLIYLGIYADPEEAARAYDKTAAAQFGEFAVLNFPRSE